MNLHDALIRFLADCEFEDLQPATVIWYEKLLSKFAEWRDGETALAEVTRADVKAFLRFKKAEGRSIATVKAYRRAIRVFFNWCVYERLVSINPAQRIRALREKEPDPRRIDLAGVQCLIDACDRDPDTIPKLRDRAIIAVLWDTGCRAGELLGLRLDDIDWENLTLLVSGKDGSRTVPIEPDAARVLADWLAVRPVDHGTDAVFLSLRRGRRGALGYSGLRIMLQRRAHEAGVREPVNPHAFRHGFGKKYIRRGGDWGTLADMLGHTDSSTTKRYYVRFDAHELKEPHARYSPLNGLDV
ncbi:MAG: tyrosine-type recombinase/integrase [Anaerolineae bacterium]|nr:tyrosine-type recombinase/integrase [Anaerolineae bacterium]